MHTIYDLITFDLEKEHELEHNPEHEKPYSEPKIYDANGDLSKRWYVYFSFKNPETGKMERSKNIYGKTNRHRTKSDRYSILNIYKKRLSKLLSEGYSPYEDNQKRFENSDRNKAKSVNTIPKKEPNGSKKSEFTQNITLPNSPTSERMRISEAFDFVLKLKTNQIGESTLADYKSRCNKFLKWIKDHKIKLKFIHELEKKHLNTFLNNILQETSARNRNNYRACLGSIFQTLEDNEIIF